MSIFTVDPEPIPNTSPFSIRSRADSATLCFLEF